jgi:hypothetical protein
MDRVISTFARELSVGGGGPPARQTLSGSDDFAARFEQALKGAAAWSPVLWKGDERRSENFESASLVAVDWEVTHEVPFPHKLYEDPDRLMAFIGSLRAGDTPLPDFAHLTEHGLRLIWLLDREITSGEDYLELIRRLALDFSGDLAAATLATGFTAARHLQKRPLVEIK